MKRPFVNLKSENKIDEFMEKLRNNLKRFESLEGVVGITLNGGMSRGYADHLSEIDLVIYLDEKYYELWNNGGSPIPEGITKFDGYLYDIKLACLEEEKKKVWSGVALWDLSYAKILYDPCGVIKELMLDKLKENPKPLQAEGTLFSCWWYFRLAGDIWIHRGDTVQGHHMLNSAAAKLVEALFLANGEYVPHEKWIMHFSRTLAWTPGNWDTMLLQAMSTGDFSIESLIKRQGVIEKLWKEIDRYIIGKECPEFKLSIMQKSFFDLFELLLKSDVMTIEEWKKHASLGFLLNEPFFSLIMIDNEKIHVNRNELFTISPEDIYSWHYEVLEACKDTIDSRKFSI